uniref:wall-associated receptor kinase-like 2 n=1 Tax=Erigeron canadensis TaxID=72917 RepID=UPI001CB93864|nr:wall-associated receptor kinase-like 2 [Erigeron canadensis]
MKLFQAYYILIFLSLRVASKEHGRYAKKGCRDMCGNVRIPYPFGIGPKCAVNKWYVVDCNSSTPYLHALNNYRFEIVSVSLKNQKITVNTPKPIFSDCQNPVTNNITQTNTIDLGGSPFWLSPSDNIFVYEGCGNAVLTDHGSTELTGCSTACLDNSSTRFDRNNNCFGIDCCQTSIPPDHYLKAYNISLITDLKFKQQGRDRASCGSAFVMDTSSYFNPSRSIAREDTFVPISLLWTLSQNDSHKVTCCPFQSMDKVIVNLGNGIPLDSRKCTSNVYYEGNPYIEDGCDVNDEGCANCTRNGGYCSSDPIYNIDGSVYKPNYHCKYFPNYKQRKSLLGVILGVSISMGVVFLVVISYAMYKLIRKTKDKRQRKKFFKRNGGILLKQQAEAHPSLVDKTILFTSRELSKATDNFNENRVLGRGGQGTVFKGMLMDGRIVAIKKSKVVDESQLEQFINEVVILSQVNHRNVVKLLGCCLETDVPLLVSEFISNGTLYDRLHNDIDEFPFSLNMRLQIATDVAGAFAYLHSATSIPIYHRDIKTTNILLDDKYRAKVSDFGTSRLVSMDQTHLTTMVKGTFGYLDPEYFQSSQFSEKSDVYSFGVVLVELITGEKPISLTRFGEHRSLATHFTFAMEEGRVMSILDAKMIKEATGNELHLIANLAMRCLNLNGKNRPTMKEVAIELETIQTSHIPSIIQTSVIPMIYGEDLAQPPYGESTSTFTSFNDSISK